MVAVRFTYLFLLLSSSSVLLIHANELVPLEDGFHHDIDDNIVTVGDDYGCVIERVDKVDIGGEIICWGNGKYQELDPPPGIFIQISAAGHSTCGISIEGNVVCWGNTPLVNQGNKLMTEEEKPYLQVSVGTDSLCILAHTGSVQCTGHKRFLANGIPTSTNFVQISCGGMQCCGIHRDGTLACWGVANGGLLNVPPGQYVQLSISPDNHGCGIRLDGNLVCWGSFISSQGGMKVWEGVYLQVTTGNKVTCAIQGDGTLFCLGETRKLYGKHAPDALTQFSEISACNMGICGITAGSDRHVLCWGEGNNGEIIADVPLDLEPTGGLLLLDLFG